MLSSRHRRAGDPNSHALKLAASFAFAAGGAFGGAGCATPGPLHVYSFAGAPDAPIHDHGDGRVAEVPGFVREGESVVAFTYDPFTDHFFLALMPGNVIRVVDRPARAIKREFTLPEPAPITLCDLAVKPRTGHLFLLDASASRIVELTRLGEFVRHISLPLTRDRAAGIAYDAARDRLLVLHAAESVRPTVTTFDLEGRPVRVHNLDRSVIGPIAFDSEARELYAAMSPVMQASIGVFDEQGHFLRWAAGPGNFVDLGPRSFIRVF